MGRTTIESIGLRGLRLGIRAGYARPYGDGRDIWVGCNRSESISIAAAPTQPNPTKKPATSTR
jgi:hypothetical protein